MGAQTVPEQVDQAVGQGPPRGGGPEGGGSSRLTLPQAQAPQWSGATVQATSHLAMGHWPLQQGCHYGFCLQ